MYMTNRGKYNTLAIKYRGASPPTNYYVSLHTSASAPGPDTNTKADLTEVSNGGGYTTGGIQLSRNSTDFDVLTEDDGNDRALIQIRDLVWTGVSGGISGARYACLTDDNATQNSREVDAAWSLGSDRSVSEGQTLTLQNCEIRLQEAA